LMVYGAGFFELETVRFYLGGLLVGTVSTGREGTISTTVLVPLEIEVPLKPGWGTLYSFRAEGDKGSKAYYPVMVTQYRQ
jgi:hypothetical protein